MVKNVSKLHSADPSTAVHAAAGDALLSLAADVSSAGQTTPFVASNVADARGDSPREDDYRWPSTLSASRTIWPTRGDLNSRLIIFRRLIMSL